jgi:hypothetical protein
MAHESFLHIPEAIPYFKAVDVISICLAGLLLWAFQPSVNVTSARTEQYLID